MDLSTTASPAEIVYTAAFALAFVVALLHSIRATKAMLKVADHRRRTGEDGPQWAVASDEMEQSVLIVVVALSLLIVGSISLFLPPNPASTNGVSAGIAFLIAAIAIIVMIVRKWKWSVTLANEIEKTKRKFGS